MEDQELGSEEMAATQAEEDKLVERLQEELRRLPVADHLLYMMQSVSTLAVDRMGLAPDARATANLEEARLAIDAFKALLDLLERARPGQLGPQRSMLSQLQFAYVGALEAGHSDAGGTDGREAGNSGAGEADGAGVDGSETDAAS